MGLWSLAFLTFTSALSQSLGLLVMAEDLFLIRASPLKRGGILAARFAMTYFASCWAALALTIPVLGPYAEVFGGGFRGWLLASASFMAVLLLPTALGAAAGLSLASFFPSGRVREWTALLGGLFAGTLILVVRILGPEKIMKPPEDQDPMVYLKGMEQALKPLPGLPWTETVFSFLKGDLPLGRLALSVLPAAVLGLGIATLLLPLWKKALESGAQGPPEKGPSWLAGLLGKAGPLRAQALKNFGLFLRDPSQSGQVLLFLMLGALYGINLRALPADIYGGILTLIGFLNIAFAGLLAAAYLSRFIFPAISGEGRSVWVLLSSPAPLRRYIHFQTLGAFLLSSLVLAGSHAWTRVSMIPEGGLDTAAYLGSASQALGLSFLTVGLGISSARFDLSPASRLLMTIPGLFCLLIQAAFVGFTLAILSSPVRALLWHGSFGGTTPQRAWLGAGLGLVLLTAGSGYFWFRTLRGLRNLGARISN